MPNLRSPRLHIAVWTLMVGIGMLLPGNALPPLGSWLPAGLTGWIDKIEHLVAFFVMTILLFRALRPSVDSRSPLSTAAGLTFGYAVLLELLQIPHPTRYWAPADILADALGVVLAMLLLRSDRMARSRDPGL